MVTAPILFDSSARRKYLTRRVSQPDYPDFLWREGADILSESLNAVLRPLPRVLELEPRTPCLTEMVRHRPGTGEVVTHTLNQELLPPTPPLFDAVVSNLSLHAVNDLPGMLVQARHALVPDGLLLMTLPGVQTLHELRHALAHTESQQRGGMTPRVAPFIDVREAGNLLQRAGFALPVVDSITLTITYPHLFALMDELRAAGESNMLADRAKHFTPRGFFVQAAQHYAAQHGNAQGKIVATAEIITVTAWKPAASQPQPARRGSGTTSLRDVF